jgi:hypothetical protein
MERSIEGKSVPYHAVECTGVHVLWICKHRKAACKGGLPKELSASHLPSHIHEPNKTGNKGHRLTPIVLACDLQRLLGTSLECPGLCTSHRCMSVVHDSSSSRDLHQSFGTHTNQACTAMATTAKLLQLLAITNGAEIADKHYCNVKGGGQQLPCQSQALLQLESAVQSVV